MGPFHVVAWAWLHLGAGVLLGHYSHEAPILEIGAPCQVYQSYVCIEGVCLQSPLTKVQRLTKRKLFQPEVVVGYNITDAIGDSKVFSDSLSVSCIHRLQQSGGLDL